MNCELRRIVDTLCFSPVRLLLPSRNTLSSPRQPNAAGRVPAPAIAAIRRASGWGWGVCEFIAKMTLTWSYFPNSFFSRLRRILQVYRESSTKSFETISEKKNIMRIITADKINVDE